GHCSPELYTLSLHDALPISIEAGKVTWCCTPRMSAKRRSTNSTLWSRMSFSTFSMDMAGSQAGGMGTPFYRASAVPTFLRHKPRSEEHTSELQSRENLVCRL